MVSIKFYWNMVIFIYVLSVATFIKQQSWIVAIENVYSVLIASQCCLVTYTNHSDAVVTWQSFQCHACNTDVFLFNYQYMPIMSKQKKWTSNVMFLRHNGVWIILLSNLIAKHLLCNNTIALLKQYNLCQYYQITLITIFPTNRKATIRTVREFKIIFHHSRIYSWKWDCNQSNFLSGSFLSQTRKFVWLNCFWLQ